MKHPRKAEFRGTERVEMARSAKLRTAEIDRHSKLASEQLRLALRNLQPNAWLMPVFATIMCAMFARWLPWPRLALWWGMVILGGIPLGVVCNRLLKRKEADADDSRSIAHATFAYSIFALSWASMGYFLWVPGNDLDHMFVMLVLACTLAGNAALIGASRELTVVGFLIYGATLTSAPLQQGGILYDGLAVMAFLYAGYLAHLSRNFYSTARDMLMLRYDKNDLIAALAASKMESDRALERAENASRAKSEFLANMSHELRTPLNAIIGFSEMIQSGAFAAKTGEYSKLIGNSGHHLLTLINDILDLAKIEAGRMTLHESDIDLAALVKDCVALMASRAQAGRIALQADLPADCPRLFADERALKQILLNLLSNAVKFTPPEGRVSVGIHPQLDGVFAITVIDNGMGIAEGDQARVFENFGQGRHDVTTAEKGTGLGLPIVKGLVEAHGGHIVLQSAAGEGTRVTIYMPASRVLSAEALRAAS